MPFRSSLLERNLPYRVILPSKISAARLPVLWLFHGADADYRSWSNETAIADFADRFDIMLVMPEARNSFYVDSADGRRYQSYLANELIPDVRRRFPIASTEREQNAAIGISRGGFGAVVMALKHPLLFSYVASMSGTMDLANRPFRWTAPLNSISYRRAFGGVGDTVRTENNPFLLLGAPGAANAAPYFYLVAGDEDPLLPSTRQFATALEQRKIPYELHVGHGGHDWGFWASQLPGIEESLMQHIRLQPSPINQ